MTVAGVTFIVEVADTPEARATGLSGRDSLGSDRGMWFDMDRTAPASFWMRRMEFPIDIIWVSESLRVTGMVARAPPPAPGTLTEDLPVYSSGGDVRYVLEINAGLAEELGIRPGDEVTVVPR